MLVLFSFIVTLFIISIFSLSEVISAKDQEEQIEICCTWGYKIKDNILTYKIRNSVESEIQDAVKASIDEWNKKLDGLLILKKETSKSKSPDIDIQFRKDNGKIGGQTVTNFDRYGFIDNVKITLSKEAFHNDIGIDMIKQISKHELGHALGLGHANFNNNLMTTIVNDGSTKISNCEIMGIIIANEWALDDDNNDGNDHLYITPSKRVSCNY